MPAQRSVQSRNSHDGPKVKIKLFGGQDHGDDRATRIIQWVDKQSKHAAWKCVAAVVNEVGRKRRTVANI